MSPTYQIIYRTVRKIPRGKVATYGQIARLAGFPGQARLVGYALNALREDNHTRVPWWRVINAKGMISLGEFTGADLQRELLENEGVVFGPRGKVNLEKHCWGR
ncbi:methyltransferase [candidate division KSB1 bacterium]|nr:MAG: methyltransferase [candidate division KSB1 bacterium]